MDPAAEEDAEDGFDAEEDDEDGGFGGNREPVISLCNSLAELMWNASIEFLWRGVLPGIA